jgi:hypothetical protein
MEFPATAGEGLCLAAEDLQQHLGTAHMVALLAQLQHVVNVQAPVAADLYHRHGVLLDQPVEVGPRDVEDLGGLLGGEQGGMGQHRDRPRRA